MTTSKEHHFFASSIAQWGTTNEERDLFDLLKLMKKDGLPFNLFLVPTHYNADYAINFYQPQVEGTQWLGFFEGESK